ncbi:hypothetical protein ACUNEB_21745 [Serratia sp. IR-2025]
MQNTLKALAALTLLAASSLAVAADLGDDMDTLAVWGGDRFWTV